MDLRPLGILGLVAAAASSALWLPPAASAADEATCAGRPATLVGSEEPDELVGTDGPDVVVALGGDDRVETLGGRDVVCGGAGDDELLLGRRADQVVWTTGDGLDAVVGNPGPNDRFDITGTPGDDTFLARTVRDEVGWALSVTVAGGGAELHGVELVTAWMGDGADTFDADRTRLSRTKEYDVHTDAAESDGAADLLRWQGHPGDDGISLAGSTGGGPATSLATLSPRGTRSFVLRSGEPADTVVVDGRGGEDSVQYLGADGSTEVALAGRTAHQVRITDRPAAADPATPVRVLRVDEPDRLEVLTQGGRDVIDLTRLHSDLRVRAYGGAWPDVFRGSAGRDFFNGGWGDDRGYGGAGDDVFLGRYHDDELDGGRGDDRLNGGSGVDVDTCRGGRGSDRFIDCEVTDRIDGIRRLPPSRQPDQ